MERKSYALAMSWMSRLLTVCREWNLDIDVVRRRFIICLYETNSCVFAEELFHTVSKPEELAKELIEIAAIRVISLIGNSFYTEINKMPSSTAFWLRALVSDSLAIRSFRLIINRFEINFFETA